MKQLSNGFTLIEVVISICLMSIAFLGYASYETLAILQTEKAFIDDKTTNLLEAMANILIYHPLLKDSYFPIWQKDVAAQIPFGIGKFQENSDKYTATICIKQNNCKIIMVSK